MANLKGNGAPTRTLQASMGDIYTDVSNSKQYKCTFAYRMGDEGVFETTWNEVKSTKTAKDEVKPAASTTPKKEVEEAAVTEDAEEVIEEKNEETVDQKEVKPTNYTNYSKKSK